MNDDSASSDCSEIGSDDDDEVLTISLSKNRVPKISGRKRDVSEAKWNDCGDFLGMAEVMKVKGQLLRTTGIVRQSKIFLYIEEVGYLMQREALRVFYKKSIMTIMDLYEFIMTGEFGCSWDAYKTYLELKTLGYIVARHKVSWSIPSPKSNRCRLECNQTSSAGELSGCLKIGEQNQSRDEYPGGDSSVEALDHGKDVACNVGITTAPEAPDDNRPSSFAEDTSVGQNEAKVNLDGSGNTTDVHSLIDKFAHGFSMEDSIRIQNYLDSISYNHIEDSESKQEPMKVVPQLGVPKDSSCTGVNLTCPCPSQDASAGHSGDLKLMFDVFSPNTKFKKTDPGIPEFSVCILSDHPPDCSNIQVLEAENGGTPVKIASVDCGRVSFFEFNTAQLPILP